MPKSIQKICVPKAGFGANGAFSARHCPRKVSQHPPLSPVATCCGCDLATEGHKIKLALGTETKRRVFSPETFYTTETPCELMFLSNMDYTIIKINKYFHIGYC